MRIVVAVLLVGVALLGAGCIIPHPHHGSHGHYYSHGYHGHHGHHGHHNYCGQHGGLHGHSR